MLPSYQSIAAQVASRLREELQRGDWQHLLPGERALAERLSVSRKTVRKALAVLRAEGLIRTERNRASAIVPAGAAPLAEPVHTVALLLPEPIESARPFTVLWVNHLMALLHEAGMQLEIVAGWKYFGAHAGRSLRRLIGTHPARCWILARSHRVLQHWFEQSGEHCLIAGSAHAGIDLPSVDIDHRALCRHAATTFLRQGHRRVALFLERAGHGGDDNSEQGFREGLATHPDAEPPLICRPAKGPTAIINELRRQQALASPPTGYLLSNSFSYLTVLSHFAQGRLRVPQDISLISRDEEPFLSHLQPVPTRYAIPPAKFAAAINQAIKRVLGRETPRRFDIRIVPDFVKGGSVGRPPPAAVRTGT
ncbi:MAG TPA: substrate-binding domain-containing protein [Opitutaceae bacterium]|nr:substrate-binding domain-containing protein [Opitutaceae bacterium]